MENAAQVEPMGEFELIERYFKRAIDSSCVKLGIGDDCAVIDVPQGYQLAFSIDSLLADVHFFADANPSLIAQRALCVSLSDLAAMGAEPLCFTLALSLPHADQQWLSGFSEGLLDTANRYGCSLVGGDTVRGPLCISIQVHGIVPSGQAITRGGAHQGDIICVTGSLGDGAAALHALKGDLSVDDAAYEYLSKRYYHPQPQLDTGAKLRNIASAAIDISDGLVSDLGHICKASGVGAQIDVHCLPISDAVRLGVSEEKSIDWALSGGDDYQLCFTVSPSEIDKLNRLTELHHLAISNIGIMTAQQGIRCSKTGRTLNKNNTGYKHF